VSAEQLYNPDSLRREDPTLLFPAVVRAAGYTMPHIHDVLGSDRGINKGKNVDHVRNSIGDGRVNGHDRIRNGEAEAHGTSSNTSGYLASSSSPSSPMQSDSRHLPPYAHPDSESAFGEPVPPYSSVVQPRGHHKSSAKNREYPSHSASRPRVANTPDTAGLPSYSRHPRLPAT
jgi:hypothetical protein